MTRQEKIALLKSISECKSLDVLKDKELTCNFGYASPLFQINGNQVSEEKYLDEVDKQIRSGKERKIKFNYGPEEPV